MVLDFQKLHAFAIRLGLNTLDTNDWHSHFSYHRHPDG
jgi:hypothetical protein